MTHPERDQDLLLLAHGALPPLRAALTRWHLAHCPDCRRRVDHLQATSRAFAGVIRGSQGRRWSAPTAGPPVGLAASGLLAVVVLAVILLGALAVRHYQHTLPAPPVPAGTAPCRPDLPSDRCR